MGQRITVVVIVNIAYKIPTKRPKICYENLTCGPSSL
jgi:hypothetical protein